MEKYVDMLTYNDQKSFGDKEGKRKPKVWRKC